MKHETIFVITDCNTPLKATTSFDDAIHMAKNRILAGAKTDNKRLPKTLYKVTEKSMYWVVSHPLSSIVIEVHIMQMRTF